MIERFALLRNTGQFHDVKQSAEIAFKRFSLLFAENGQGKTTIASILRSLAIDDASLVMDRKRLGAQDDPHIVVEQGGGKSVFQNGVWSQILPEIAIFDDSFVANNVCSGTDIHPYHRQNLHELILGSEGVDLNNALKDCFTKSEQHKINLRIKSDAIDPFAKGVFFTDEFCELKEDPDIDDKIKKAKRRLAAAQEADTIRETPEFSALSFPDFDMEEINRVLMTKLDNLSADVAKTMHKHIASIGVGGERWISEGMPRIINDEHKHSEEYCPFCAQDLCESDIIGLYRKHFSEAYDALKAVIHQMDVKVRDTHGQEAQANLKRRIQGTLFNYFFWRKFVDIPKPDVDIVTISHDWNPARENVLECLRLKIASPLEQVEFSSDTVQIYQARITEVNKIFERLIDYNKQVAEVKEQAGKDDIDVLRKELLQLQSQRDRYEPANVVACEDYLTERSAKEETEKLRKETRKKLDEYRKQIFPAYEKDINNYLKSFGAPFQIAEVKPVNHGGSSSASYSVVINNHNVNMTAPNGPTFRNTLSAGDRNTLALALFFASLKNESNLDQKIIVFDDPMTSLDEHRKFATRQEMMELYTHVSQMVVLSHSRTFLCALWERTRDKTVCSAIRLNKAKEGSKFEEWDVQSDSITEHDKLHKLVTDYVTGNCTKDEEKVATSLRLILEHFLRVAFPQYFPPEGTVGPFHEICKQKIGTPDEILSQEDVDELGKIQEFQNSFHHIDAAPISGEELRTFANRVLDFATRK